MGQIDPGGWNIYITICKIDSHWKVSVWQGNSNQMLCDDPEVWDGAGDGKEGQEGEDICIPEADSYW